jgi:hypothetical protein
MSDECVICTKKLGVGVNRFVHLMGHLQEGTAHAKLDVKNEYWYFHPTIEGMKRYRGLKINISEPKKQNEPNPEERR